MLWERAIFRILAVVTLLRVSSVDALVGVLRHIAGVFELDVAMTRAKPVGRDRRGTIFCCGWVLWLGLVLPERLAEASFFDIFA